MKKWKKQLKSYLSFENQVKEIRGAHMIDIIIRINGEDKKYEADWIKTLINEEL